MDDYGSTAIFWAVLAEHDMTECNTVYVNLMDDSRSLLTEAVDLGPVAIVRLLLSHCSAPGLPAGEAISCAGANIELSGASRYYGTLLQTAVIYPGLSTCGQGAVRS